MLTACILIAVYLMLTLVTPRLLARRRLLVEHPQLLIRLWLTALSIACLALLSALGIFISLALRHHINHISGHDITGPLIDSLLGWLAIAVIGLVAFRLGVAAQETRATYREVGTLLTPVLASARVQEVGVHRIWIVDSGQSLIAALPQARRVVITTRVLELLQPKEIAAVVEHESSHLRHHHERVLALGSLAEAVAPAFLAGTRFAQTCRIATELIADDDAANICGANVLAAALAKTYPDEAGVADRIKRLRSR